MLLKCYTGEEKQKEREMMAIHIVEKHLKQFHYRCPHCLYARFPTRRSVELHVQIIHPLEVDKSVLCDPTEEWNAFNKKLKSALDRCGKIQTFIDLEIGKEMEERQNESLKTPKVEILTDFENISPEQEQISNEQNQQSSSPNSLASQSFNVF